MFYLYLCLFAAVIKNRIKLLISFNCSRPVFLFMLFVQHIYTFNKLLALLINYVYRNVHKYYSLFMKIKYNINRSQVVLFVQFWMYRGTRHIVSSVVDTKPIQWCRIESRLCTLSHDPEWYHFNGSLFEMDGILEEPKWNSCFNILHWNILLTRLNFDKMAFKSQYLSGFSPFLLR